MTSTGHLPATRTYPFTVSGRLLDVTIGYPAWPEIIVVIAERGRGQVLEARFREDGSLHRLTFAADQGEITTADLRRPALIRTARQWEAFGREWARRKLAGEPEPEIGTSGPAEALRILAQGTPRNTRARRTGADREQLIRDVADAYRQALDADDPAPRQTIAARLGYSIHTIAHLVAEARKPRNGHPPLLGPAIRGRAGEAREETEHAA